MTSLETYHTDETALRAGSPVHFVGIGGCGMSGLARLLLGWGEAVTGSDLSLTPGTEMLSDAGAVLFQGNRAEHIHPDCRAIVATAAASDANPEIVEARRRGLPVYKYAEMVGRVAEGRDMIAVAGTHGKSTTTGLLSYLLTMAGLEPSFLVGADVPQLGASSGAGQGKHFVVEACEFDRSFLNYRPKIAIVTNIEADHLDYFRDLDEIHEAFLQFAARVRPGGRLIVHHSVAELFRNDPRVEAEVTTYGLEKGADWRPRAVRLEGRETVFQIDVCGVRCGPFRTNIPGVHNVLNATAALAAASNAGAQLSDLARILPGYSGVGRRFQVLLDRPELTLVDDYGHHPTEIRAVLDVATRAYRDRRLWVVFQPHQHSRTRLMLDEFGRAFHRADRTIVTDILAVRDSEADRQSVHARDLVGRILASDGRAYYVSGFDAVFEHLERSVLPGDVVLTMGAGTIGRFAVELARRAATWTIPAPRTEGETGR